MIVPIMIAVALALAFVPAGVFRLRRRRRPSDLRGDWWSQFEAEFRAYAAGLTAAPERARRPRDSRQPPPWT